MTLWSNIIRGVALGDSYGNPNEFQSIAMLTRDNERGPELPKFLEITDDTQMTLYLGAALDDSWGGTEDEIKAAIIDAYLKYNVDPDNNRAPGITVTSSLAALGRIPAAERLTDWARATSKTSDGCGSVMRATPTAFLPEDLWVGVTAFAAALTHGTPNAVASALLNVALLRDILAGTVKAGELTERALQIAETPGPRGLIEVGTWLNGLDIDLADGFKTLAQSLVQAMTELPGLQADPWALGSDPSLQRSTEQSYNRGGGWRAHTCLISAILAVDMFPTQPYLALRRAVTTDGDSDSIGAVAGGLLGAAHPIVFIDLWERGLKSDGTVRDRIEERYVRWIEGEADGYPFVDPQKLVDVAK
jgi:ADP-ribosylglycohydrolase